MATSGSTYPTPPRQPMQTCGDCGAQSEASNTRCVTCQARLALAEIRPTSPFDATSITCITACGAEQIRLLLIKRGAIPSEQLTLISGGQDPLLSEAI